MTGRTSVRSRRAALVSLAVVAPLLAAPADARLVPGPAAPAPDTTITTPLDGTRHVPTNRPDVLVAGTASGEVDRVRVWVRDAARGTWVRPPAPAGATRAWHRARGTDEWSLRVVLAPGRYVVTARAETAGRPDPTPSKVRLQVRGRDPLRWPYPSDSFWNTPRGRDARLVPFRMTPPEKTFRAEEDLLFLAPDLPVGQWSRLSPHDAGWNGDRCDARWNRAVPLAGDTWFPMPPLVDGTQSGDFPNHSTAIVMPDYTLRETQPLAVCGKGLTSQYASPRWQGDSLLTGGRGPTRSGRAGGGSHGGSFMTAFGGTIRLGEWVRRGNIPHATKIEVWSQRWLTQDRRLFPGHRWPASAADDGWDGRDGYGTSAPSPRSPHAVMGALLTLPETFPVARLRTAPARILARSFRDYGTYLVDGTGRDTVAVATEWSAEGRVIDEFEREFGFSPVGDWEPGVRTPQNAFLADLRLVYRSLQLVADNGPASVGGAGPRLTRPAPPLQRPERP